MDAGGRLSFPTLAGAKTFAANLWDTLDKVREHVADMVLIHGGDPKGVDRLASTWAEKRKVPQVAFGLDSRLGARAGFRRNEQMLSLNPRYVVAFAGNGVLERWSFRPRTGRSKSSIAAARSAPIRNEPRPLPLRNDTPGWTGSSFLHRRRPGPPVEHGYMADRA